MTSKENPAPDASSPRFRFRLFVAQGENNSRQALENIKRILDETIGGDYRLQVVDVLTDWQAALEEGVMITPMLIMDAPHKTALAGVLDEPEKVIKSLMLGTGK